MIRTDWHQRGRGAGQQQTFESTVVVFIKLFIFTPKHYKTVWHCCLPARTAQVQIPGNFLCVFYIPLPCLGGHQGPFPHAVQQQVKCQI